MFGMTAFPADFRKRFVAYYPTAIQRPRGIAQRQSSAPRLPAAWAKFNADDMAILLPQRTTFISKFFSI
jgi:hypothetical protein